MNIGSFFSGIGGLDLGLERAGLGRTVYQCQASSAVLGDKDGYADHAVAVLRARFPSAVVDTRSIEDVSLVAGEFGVIAGGFPCQDVSVAGKGEGLAGKRSGLWYTMLRRVAECLPHVVVAENVAALQSRGLDDVAEGLRELGYSVWATRIRAEDVGAPHRRERILIVAAMRAHGTGEVGRLDGFGGRWTLLNRRGVKVARWMDGQGRETFPEPGNWWPTPVKANRANTCHGKRRPGLEEAPRAWAIPTVKGNHNRAGLSPTSGDGLATQANTWADAVGGPLNPAWVELLMGFPPGWTDPGADLVEWPGWPMPQGLDQHPYEPPRMVAPRSCPARKQRIMTIGNAVAPQVGYIAGRFAVQVLAGEERGQLALL